MLARDPRRRLFAAFGARRARWHKKRPELRGRTPVHVAIRVRKGTWSLRSRRGFRIAREALIAANGKIRFGVVEYSVQRNHLHLIVEAEDTYALSRAMRGLSIRIAKRINALMGERGARIVDRYFMHVLRTPLEVSLALRYVLNNFRRHAAQRGRRVDPRWMDPCSTARWFQGWSGPRRRARDPCPDLQSGVVPARTRVLREDWRLYGPIELAFVPGPERDRARIGSGAEHRA